MRVNPSLRLPEPTTWQWQTFQLGVLLLFFVPNVGAVLLTIAMLGTIRQTWPSWSQHPLTQAWGVIFLLMLGSSVIAIAPLDALLGMANIMPFGLLTTVLLFLVNCPDQLRRLSQLLIVGSTPLLIMGFGQMIWGWSTPDWWSKISGWSLVAGGNPTGRMASGLMYANLYACYLLVLLCLTLGLGLEQYRRWRQEQTSQHLWRLLLFICAIGGDSVSIFATQSRNVWFVATFSFIVFFVYAGWRSLVLFIAALGTVIAWASWLPAWGGSILRTIVPEALWRRLSGEQFVVHDHASRLTQWQFCWQQIQERPLTGWGLRSFEALYNAEITEGRWHWILHPHNLFLMLGSEVGIPLLLLICGWVAWCCYPLVRQFRGLTKSNRLLAFSYLTTFVAVMGFNLLDVSLFDFRTNLLGWLLLGAIAGVGRGITPASVEN